MQESISNLNRYNRKDFAIYVLDDYAVCLMPKVRKALYQRNYVLVIMGGGITGFIKIKMTLIFVIISRVTIEMRKWS